MVQDLGTARASLPVAVLAAAVRAMAIRVVRLGFWVRDLLVVME
jgi:hypothetical protein